MTVARASWGEFARRQPDFANLVLKRFDSHRHAILASLTSDGSPRLSGLEAPIRDGELWLAMMPNSLKAIDLRRDSRFSIHSAPDAEDMALGDAKIDGWAAAASDGEVELFVSGHRFAIDDPSTMALFRAEIRRVTCSRVEGEQMVVESWTPAQGLQVK